MCGFRFALDFVREVPTVAFDLTTAQLAAAAGLAFFATRFVLLARRAPSRAFVSSRVAPTA
jgi:hypothetical protein